MKNNIFLHTFAYGLLISISTIMPMELAINPTKQAISNNIYQYSENNKSYIKIKKDGSFNNKKIIDYSALHQCKNFYTGNLIVENNKPSIIITHAIDRDLDETTSLKKALSIHSHDLTYAQMFTIEKTVNQPKSILVIDDEKNSYFITPQFIVYSSQAESLSQSEESSSDEDDYYVTIQKACANSPCHGTSVAEISNKSLPIYDAIETPLQDYGTNTYYVTFCDFDGKIDTIPFEDSSESNRYIYVTKENEVEFKHFYIDLSTIKEKKETIILKNIYHSSDNNFSYHKVNTDGTIDNPIKNLNQYYTYNINYYKGTLIIKNSTPFIKVTHSLNPVFNTQERITNKKLAFVTLTTEQIKALYDKNYSDYASNNVVIIDNSNDMYFLEPHFLPNYSRLIESESDNDSFDK